MEIYSHDNVTRVVQMTAPSLDLIKNIIDLVREYNTKNSASTITIQFTKTHVVFKNTIYVSSCINYIEIPVSWFTSYEFLYSGKNNPEVNIEIKTLQKIVERCIFMKSTSFKKSYNISVVYINGNEEKYLIIEHNELNAHSSFQLISLDIPFEINEDDIIKIPRHSITIDSIHIHNLFNMFYGKTEDMKRFSVMYYNNKLVFTNREHKYTYSIEVKADNIDDEMNKTFNSVCLHGLFNGNTSTHITLSTNDREAPMLWRFDAVWGQSTIVKYYIWTGCLVDDETQPTKKMKKK